MAGGVIECISYPPGVAYLAPKKVFETIEYDLLLTKLSSYFHQNTINKSNFNLVGWCRRSRMRYVFLEPIAMTRGVERGSILCLFVLLI